MSRRLNESLKTDKKYNEASRNESKSDAGSSLFGRKVGFKPSNTLNEEQNRDFGRESEISTKSRLSSAVSRLTNISQSISFCSYRNVGNQVVPSEESQRQPDSYLNFSNHLQDIIFSTKTKDLLDFILNLQMEFLSDEEIIVSKNTSLSIVKYYSDPNLFSLSTPFRRYLNRTIGKKISSKDDLSLWFALHELVISFIENIRRTEEGFISSKSSISSSSVTLDGCLALTDITLMAANNYLRAHQGISGQVIDKLAQAVDNLFLKCHSLGPLLESSNELSVKLLLSQSISRACTTIHTLSGLASLPQNIKIAKTIVQLSASLFQSLSPNLIMCRRISEDTSSQCLLLFWKCSDLLIDLILKHKLSEPSNEKVGHGGRKERKEQLPPILETSQNKKVILVKSKSISVQSLPTRIRQAVQSTILTPQEFFGKISRLKNTNMMKNSTMSSEATDGEDGSRGFESTTSHSEQRLRGSYIDQSPIGGIGNFNGRTTLGISMIKDFGDPTPFAATAFRIKHTLVGFQYLLRMSLIEAKELYLPVQYGNDWISSFAESFLLLLPSSNVFSLNDRLLEDGFDKILPFLIELWFQLSVGSEILPHHDWLFWELTKRLSNFVEVKQKQRHPHRASFAGTRRFYDGDDPKTPNDSGKANMRSRRPSTVSVTKDQAQLKKRPSMKKLNSTVNMINNSLNNNSLNDSSHNIQNGRKESAGLKSLRNTPSSSNLRKMSRDVSYSSLQHLNNNSMASLRKPSFRKAPSRRGRALSTATSHTSTSHTSKESSHKEFVEFEQPTPVYSMKYLTKLARSKSRMKNSENDEDGDTVKVGIDIESKSSSSNNIESNRGSLNDSNRGSLNNNESNRGSLNESNRGSSTLPPHIEENSIASISKDDSVERQSKSLPSLLNLDNIIISPSTNRSQSTDNNAVKSNTSPRKVISLNLSLLNNNNNNNNNNINEKNLNLKENSFEDVKNENSKIVSPLNLKASLPSLSLPLSTLTNSHSNSNIVTSTSAPPILSHSEQNSSLNNNKDNNSNNNSNNNSLRSNINSQRNSSRIIGTLPKLKLSFSKSSNDNDNDENENTNSLSTLKKSIQDNLGSQIDDTNEVEINKNEKQLNLLSTPQQQNSNVNKYLVGDKVDGLYTLPNKKKRWFAGKILRVHDDGTYKILYNDGEVEDLKKDEDVRKTKISNPTLIIPSNNNNSGLRKISKQESVEFVSRKRSNTNKFISALSVGDEIFGLYTLQNKKKRWFPGKVLEANTDETFKIIYNDGEEEDQKPLVELRRQKQIQVFNHQTNEMITVNTYGAKIRSIRYLKGRKSSKSGFSHSQSVHSLTNASLLNIYLPGEEIDGLFTLKNGKQRWFAGKIISWISDVLYKIEYVDGDVEDNKHISEIRKSKIKRNKSPKNNININSLFQPEIIINSNLTSSTHLNMNRIINSNQHYHNEKTNISSSTSSTTFVSVKLENNNFNNNFNVNDLVDGLYTLSSGGQRWFPGKIIKINNNNTFDICYNDGEIESNKKIENIRKTKIANDENNNINNINNNNLNSNVNSNIIENKKHQTESDFKVGDKVDGLFTLSNGSNRWFPGIIEKINNNNNTLSYCVKYDDGDIQDNKPKEELRKIIKDDDGVHIKVSNHSNSELNKLNHINHITEHHHVLPTINEINRSYSDESQMHNFNNNNNNKSNILSINLNLSVVKSLNNSNKSDKSNKSKSSFVENVKETSMRIRFESTSTSSTNINNNKDKDTNGVEIVKNVNTNNIEIESSVATDFRTEEDENEDYDDYNEEDDEDDDDNVFTIPSVFGASRQNEIFEDIPSMNFHRLNLSGALQRSAASNSLSSSIIIEGSENFVRDHMGGDVFNNMEDVEEVDEEYDDDDYYDDDYEEYDDEDNNNNNNEEEEEDLIDGYQYNSKDEDDYFYEQNPRSPLKNNYLKSNTNSNANSNTSSIQNSLNNSASNGSPPVSILKPSIRKSQEISSGRKENNISIVPVIPSSAAITATLSTMSSRIQESFKTFVEKETDNTSSNQNSLNNNSINEKSKVKIIEDVSNKSNTNASKKTSSFILSNIPTQAEFGKNNKINSNSNKSADWVSIRSSNKSSNVDKDSLGEVSEEINNGNNISLTPLRKSINEMLQESAIKIVKPLNFIETNISNKNNDNIENNEDTIDNNNNINNPASRILSNLQMPSTPPFNNLLSSRSEVKNILLKSKDNSNENAKESNNITLNRQVSFSSFSLPLNNLPQEEFIITSSSPSNDVLSQTFRLIIILLLRRCIVDKYFLDPVCCNSRVLSNSNNNTTNNRNNNNFSNSNNNSGSNPNHHDFILNSNDAKTLSTYSRQNTDRSEHSSRGTIAPLKHINLLFNVREYLELIQNNSSRENRENREDSVNNISTTLSFFIEISNSLGPSYRRLLKLLSGNYFISCLPNHLETAEKIGGGGFGSIYRFTCPGNCSKSELSRLSMKAFYSQLVHHISGNNNDNYSFSNSSFNNYMSSNNSPFNNLCHPCLLNNCSEWLENNCPCCSTNKKLKNSNIFSLLSPDSSYDTTLHNIDDSNINNLFNNANNNFSGHVQQPLDHVYAVKRIPRERSVHDNQIVCGVFEEVSSLEVLSGTNGVCQLFDYGVHGGEYWIVMESGGPNLSEWRRRNMDSGGYGPFKRFFRSHFMQQQQTSNKNDNYSSYDRNDRNDRSDSRGGEEIMLTSRVKEEFNEFSDVVLSLKDTALCLAVFLDILYIIQSVHAADVVHFDLKCDNLVIKGKLNDEYELSQANHNHSHYGQFNNNSGSVPAFSISESTRRKQLSTKVNDLSLDYKALRLAHRHGRTSGRILVVDFGESMSYISSPRNRSSTFAASHRVRGTMAIQSPEILCLSNENHFNNNNKDKKKFPLPGKASDVWSLGCLLVELLTGQFLFAERPWVDLFVNLCKSNSITTEMLQLDRLEQSLSNNSNRVRNSIVNVVINTLRQMPDERPSISQLIIWINDILNDEGFKFLDDDTPRNSIYNSRNQGNLNETTNDIESNKNFEQKLIGEIFDEISREYVRMKESFVVTMGSKLMLRLTDDSASLNSNCQSQQFSQLSYSNKSFKSTQSNVVSEEFSPLLLIDITSAISNRVSLFQTKCDDNNMNSNISSPIGSNNNLNNSNIKNSNKNVVNDESKSQDEFNLESNFVRIENLLGSCDLSRVSKDLGLRILQNSLSYKNLLQIVLVEQEDQLSLIKQNITTYKLSLNVFPILVDASAVNEVDSLLKIVKDAFNLCRNHLCDGNSVLVTVGSRPRRRNDSYINQNTGSYLDRTILSPKSETTRATKEKRDQEYSKLSVSIACCIIDCLTTWESLSKLIPKDEYESGSTILHSSRAMKVKNFITQKVNENSISDGVLRASVASANSKASSKTSRVADTLMEMGCGSQGITSIAPVLEKICCRRVSKIVADYLGKNAFSE